MLSFPFFSSRGVLGLNARNLLYVRPYNERRAMLFADDKLKTKLFLSVRGVPVPRVYATIATRDQLRAFDFSTLPDQCVLKPNFGFGGEGIRILKGRKGRAFLEKGKIPVSERDLFEHIEDILDGKFSVNGKNDTAFFEELLVPHSCFTPFRPAGLPDLRIVVFNLVPVMAMLRIPTAESGGKANLHMGGIGIGIDLAKGTTTYAAQRNKQIQRLPHGADFRNIAIPYWDEILLACSRIQHVTKIGYLAVDMTIDQEGGPKLLEVNARAGLAVQIANLAPLRSRLERVAGLSVPTPEKGVLLGKELFGHTAVSRPARDATTPTVGLYDVLTIATEEANIEIACTLDMHQERTAFSPDLIRELLGRNALEPENEEEGTYRVRFTLAGKKIQTIVVSKPLPDLDVRVSLGKRDLKGFLIDPDKRAGKKEKTKRTTIKADLYGVDRQLKQISQDIPFLRALRPLDLDEHLARIEEDDAYEPKFSYQPLPFDSADMRGEIEELRTDNSPLGVLLKKKKDELIKRLDLLDARGDSARFTRASAALFGLPTATLLSSARTLLSAAHEVKPPKQDSPKSALKVKAQFEKVLERYGLHEWDVRIRDTLLADCAVGGKHVYLRKGAVFEPAHIEALIAHEIEAHVLTAENAAEQPYNLLRIGCANYLDTQEGLAIYLQNRVLPPGHDKRLWAPRGVLGIAHALDHGFASLRAYLREIGYTEEKALRKAISLSRGKGDTSVPGCFTKDLAYFRGLLKIQAFVDEGGDLKRLYVGRIALEDLELVERLKGIKAPTLYPLFLRHPQKPSS